MDSIFTITGTLTKDPPKPRITKFGGNKSITNIILSVRSDATSNLILPNGTSQNAMSLSLLFSLNEAMLKKDTQWTTGLGVPKYLKKGARLHITGNMEGTPAKGTKPEEGNLHSVFVTAKQIVPITTPDQTNIAIGSARVMYSKSSANGVLYLVKEAKRKSAKFRMYRIFTPITEHIIPDDMLLNYTGHVVSRIFTVNKTYPAFGIHNLPLYYASKIHGNIQ